MVRNRELLPGLPDDMGLECLTRLQTTTHRDATRVCKRWRDLFLSKEFYIHRKQTGRTHKVACFVQALPKSASSYGLTVFDPTYDTWTLLDPIPKYPNGLPYFCRLCSGQGKLIVMGGWDPSTYSPLSDVFVYDFTTQSWSKGKDMPDNRSFFAAGELNERVIIAGGHDESKNALDSAWAYDVREDEWSRLPPMSQERDECESVVVGSEFWVIGGYRTESQGRFERSAESYTVERGHWKRKLIEEETWPWKLLSLTEIKVSACKFLLDDSTIIVFGTCSQGRGRGLQEFYIFEDDTGKFNKLGVPADYRHYAQSGCFLEL